jgi:Excinuclease ATPase subunit
LKRAGKSVAVLDTKNILRGVTGYTTAKVTSGHSLIYDRLSKNHGERAARTYAQANQAALEQIATFVKEETIECDFERQANYVYCEAEEEVPSIEAEVEAATRAGLPVSFVTETSLPYPIAGAIRLENQAQFHPRKYLLHFANQVAREGSYLFEGTRVRGVKEGKPREIYAQPGMLRAEQVIVATNYPFLDRGAATADVVFSTERACPSCGRGFPDLDPRLFSYNSKHGWCERCYGTGLLMCGFDEEQTGEEIGWNAGWEGAERVCEACHGTRLNQTALAVRLEKRSIAELAALSVEAAEKFFSALKLRGRGAEIARDILPEIASRLQFLKQVGLGYLTLDRSAPTLSGGEAQRIRLASQLGSNLRGVCYILDEPTIGLHHRDNLKLLDTLVRLEEKGNTVATSSF